MQLFEVMGIQELAYDIRYGLEYLNPAKHKKSTFSRAAKLATSVANITCMNTICEEGISVPMSCKQGCIFETNCKAERVVSMFTSSHSLDGGVLAFCRSCMCFLQGTFPTFSLALVFKSVDLVQYTFLKDSLFLINDKVSRFEKYKVLSCCSCLHVSPPAPMGLRIKNNFCCDCRMYCTILLCVSQIQ